VSYIVVASVVLAFALIELLYPGLTKLQSAAISFFSGILLGLLLTVFFRGRFKCPRCSADFRKLRLAQFGRFSTDRRIYWELWDACPNCGVSFDEPFSTRPDR
jgi:ribosomal protein S27AE